MEFTTTTGRQDYFDLLNADPCRVWFGAAMSHARTAELGIWGDEHQLKQDCALIMVFEVKKYTIEVIGEDIPVSRDNVMSSEQFQNAFSNARGGPREQVNSVLRQLGHQAGNPHLVRACMAEDRPATASDQPVHELVYEELKRRRIPGDEFLGRYRF